MIHDPSLRSLGDGSFGSFFSTQMDSLDGLEMEGEPL